MAGERGQNSWAPLTANRSPYKSPFPPPTGTQAHLPHLPYSAEPTGTRHVETHPDTPSKPLRHKGTQGHTRRHSTCYTGRTTAHHMHSVRTVRPPGHDPAREARGQTPAKEALPVGPAGSPRLAQSSRGAFSTPVCKRPPLRHLPGPLCLPQQALWASLWLMTHSAELELSDHFAFLSGRAVLERRDCVLRASDSLACRLACRAGLLCNALNE